MPVYLPTVADTQWAYAQRDGQAAEAMAAAVFLPVKLQKYHVIINFTNINPPLFKQSY